MIRINNIALPLDASGEELTRRAAKKLHVGAGRIAQLRLVKKAVDARDKTDVHFVCSVDVSLHGDEQAALLRAAGVGETTALRIIEYREATPFTSVDDLLQVKGIGEKTLEKFRSLIKVQLPHEDAPGGSRRIG